ncbi:hypothetical protein L2E82_45455 [Cichorium intybus]|uniref:Uncharacterized protein n=1 Tax=Cichorium intybus TaxID=13427 RepID=A0ACB8ZSM7_CICIN|nr:hypothetical protein L2E82_45455 [Cichorium intybus]
MHILYRKSFFFSFLYHLNKTTKLLLSQIVTANLDLEFFDEELAFRFQLSDDEEIDSLEHHVIVESKKSNLDQFASLPVNWPWDMLPMSIE